MLRRTLMRTGLGALAALSGSSRAAAQQRLPGEGLRLGFDSYSVRAFNWKAIELLDYTASLKLDSIQFSSLNDYESLEPAYLQRVKQHAARLGITLDAGMGSICPTSASWNPKEVDPAQYALKGLRVAQAIGSKVVRTFLGSRPDRRGKLPMEAHIANTVKVLLGAQ